MSMVHRDIGFVGEAPDAGHSPSLLRRQLQFEALLADISTRLLDTSAESVENEITESLSRLAHYLDVDLATVSAANPDTGVIGAICSWAREGIAPVPLGMGEAELPWTAAQLRKGVPVIYSRPEDLPPEAAADVAAARHIGARSVALLPLSAGGALVGAVTFSTVHRDVRWPDAIVQRLRLIGEMFASVLLRRDSERKLLSALREVETLKERLEAENAYLREDALDPAARTDTVGQSRALRSVLARIEQVAPTDATVLVLGETGVGKELVAKEIHDKSARREATFVKVNCAALPATLIESELFGHERGAFTGATARKLGRFELAHSGTVFLDEIGELPLDVQAKLLRVLQDGEMERIGSEVTRRVDVRVVAATNRDLRAAVADRTFRADLYYRLAVFPIEVPPLRARREDIPLLVWYFLGQFRATLGKTIDSVSTTVMARLLAYDWPGNVRELRNVIERAVIISKSSTLMLDDVFDATRLPDDRSVSRSEIRREQTLEEVEREHILTVLEACQWHIRGRAQAAERLGLNPSTLYSRMKKLRIRRPAC